MSVLEEVLLEEYDRSMRIKKAILKEQESLPKGSLQKKHIHGVDCHYLVYRDGNSVKSKYVNKKDLADFQSQIDKRRENVKLLKELEKSLRQIEKALGKDILNEHAAEGVY